jgi:pilus retraction protein PilT
MPEPNNPPQGAAFDEDVSFADLAREPSPETCTGDAPAPSGRQVLEGWLAQMVEHQASDLILRASSRPSLRVAGSIRFLPGRVPGPGPMTEIMTAILGTERMAEWSSSGAVDAAIQLDGLGRFRINAYKQMGEPALVIRRIGSSAPDLTQLNLPHEELAELAMRRRGLVLVTGVAGSGKSTTLAAMIEHMNRHGERHVITLEDPVELLYQEQRCVISQREVGSDTPTFAQGLRHALRQSPDVILIGEVRDAATIEAALEAAETGHLVLSTLHTVNAAQTLDRILGFFPDSAGEQVRARLAENLVGVLGQRLLPCDVGGQVPAYELMVTNPHLRQCILEGEPGEMARVIAAGGPGLTSYNHCLEGLVRSRRVELDEALAASDRPEELLLSLRGIRSGLEKTLRMGDDERHPQDEPHGPDHGPGPGGLRLSGSE